jgi:ubiquinone/menaquinone biosynthesis C-methylase UbiE
MNNISQAIGKYPVAHVPPVKSDTGPDIAAVKSKMKATWMDGDYATFAQYMEPGAREVLRQWDIRPGERVLDVACGAGQTAIPAAEAGAHVTGVDIATNLIAAARERAARQGVAVRFEAGDAEQLPCDTASFDTLITMFGAMFAPRPERVVHELARVCKPGGRLRMANWTAQGMSGQMFRTVAAHVPPPAGAAPPVLWGEEETVRERLGEDFTDITLTRRIYPAWSYPFSVAQLVDFFRTWFGPVKRAFAALDDEGQKSLRDALEANFAAHNMATDGTVRLGSEYLDVYATRR